MLLSRSDLQIASDYRTSLREEYGFATVPEPASSPLAAALDSVGDRWTLLLVEALLDGPRRFGDLQETCRGSRPTCSPSACAASRARGSWSRSPTRSARQRFVYELTASGHELAGALRLLADWGARHREGGEPPRHDACGTPVEARWWCPTCERPVDEDEAGGLHFA